MSNGINAKAFAARIKVASPSERSEIWGRFFAWIREGAKAQGNLGGVGLLLIFGGVGIPCAWYASPYPAPEPWIVTACAIPVAAGVFAFREASRREAAWRARNPFEF